MTKQSRNRRKERRAERSTPTMKIWSRKSGTNYDWQLKGFYRNLTKDEMKTVKEAKYIHTGLI